MSTRTKSPQKTTLKKLQQEVQLLRSLCISVLGLRTTIHDEQEFDAKTVAEIFRALDEKPTYTFTTTDDFLKQLKQV